MKKIADIHCDLLDFLAASPENSAFDEQFIVSIPKLLAGGVVFQALPIFCMTAKGSSALGIKQSELYRKLVGENRQTVSQIKNVRDLDAINPSEKVGVMCAIENGSSFCSEAENIKEGLSNLSTIIKNVERLLYVSLTWNEENTFGGGNITSVGLKENGRVLLEFLSEKKIPVDLAHASDKLCGDIFEFNDKRNLGLKFLVSHIGFRSLFHDCRNISDDTAKEIEKRGGIIGLFFLKIFLGSGDKKDILKHFEYGFYLGLNKNLCFGADFFYQGNLPPELKSDDPYTFFYEGLDDASKYRNLLDVLLKSKNFSDKEIEGISFTNFRNFLASNF